MKNIMLAYPTIFAIIISSEADAMFKFQIGTNFSHVTSLQCVWIKPHSSSLTNVENLTSNFGQFVKICYGEKEKEENSDHCKAFSLHVNAVKHFSELLHAALQDQALQTRLVSRWNLIC